MKWTEECKISFQKLKAYLADPPHLVSPILGDKLYLYLAITEHAISSVLVKEDGKIHWLVYYTSKSLLDPEKRYTPPEKLALALITAAWKLRPYFQAHQIMVLNDQPLHQILHKPYLLGRLVKWLIELSEFDIKYQPHKAIKAQKLADFITERSVMKGMMIREPTKTTAMQETTQ